MARFGGMTALRAALGGITGGLEGLSEQRQMAEQKRIQDEQEARIRRAEELNLLNSGWMLPEEFSKRTMPGATPQKPYATQMVNGKTFVMAESPEARQNREALQASVRAAQADAAKRKSLQQERDALQEKERNQFIKSMTGRQINGRTVSQKDAEALADVPQEMRSALLESMFPRPERLTPFQSASLAESIAEREARLNEAEAWARAETVSQKDAGRLGLAFRKMRQSNPKATDREIWLAIYNMWNRDRTAFTGIPAKASNAISGNQFNFNAPPGSGFSAVQSNKQNQVGPTVDRTYLDQQFNKVNQ